MLAFVMRQARFRYRSCACCLYLGLFWPEPIMVSGGGMVSHADYCRLAELSRYVESTGRVRCVNA